MWPSSQTCFPSRDLWKTHAPRQNLGVQKAEEDIYIYIIISYIVQSKQYWMCFSCSCSIPESSEPRTKSTSASEPKKAA